MSVKPTNKVSSEPIARNVTPRSNSFVLRNTATRFLITSLGFGPLLMLVQSASKSDPKSPRGLVKQFTEAITEIFDNAVIADPERKKEKINRVRMHAQTYIDLQPYFLIAVQIVSLTKYVVVFILFVSFKKLALQYYQLPSPELTREVVGRAVVVAYAYLIILVLPKIELGLLAEILFERAKQRGNLYQTFNRISVILKLAKLWPLILMLVYVISVIRLQRTVFHAGLDLNQHVKYLGLLLTITVAMVIRGISLLSQVCGYLFNRIRNQQAESVITVHLVILNQILRSGGESFGYKMRRGMVISLLGDIASRFEVSLPKQIIGSDLESPSLTQDLARIGAALRALKRRVTIPKSESWDEELRQELSDFLLKFLSLNWAELPTAEVEKLSTSTILSQTKQFARYLITAAIPAILLAILQATPFHLTGQNREIAIIVAVAWFALSIVLQLDPDVSAKTKALKEIQDIVSLKSKQS